jgi:hypothetical protein
MATNTCRPNHFSGLSASDDNCLILEVIFLFIPCKDMSFSSIVCIVMDFFYLSLLWISVWLKTNKQKVITISFLMSEIIIYNNIKLYYKCITQVSFSSYLTSESQLVAPRGQWTFESMFFFLLNSCANLFQNVLKICFSALWSTRISKTSLRF